MCDDFWEKRVEHSSKKLLLTPVQVTGNPLEFNLTQRLSLLHFTSLAILKGLEVSPRPLTGSV